LLRKYDAVVDPLFDRVLSAIRESNTLAALRDALLPKLLSGELQVPLEGDAHEPKNATARIAICRNMAKQLFPKRKQFEGMKSTGNS
jgi:hypothetical protein